MRWLLYAGAFIVVVTAIIVGIGYLLPIRHIATRHARYRQAPETVYPLVAGPQNWRPDLTRWEELPGQGGAKRWKEYSKHGAITYEITKADQPRTFQTRIADRNLPFGGTWTWDITPAPGGCDLRITEDGEIYNPIFRFVSRFIMGYTTTIDNYLTALGNKLGEKVVIES